VDMWICFCGSMMLSPYVKWMSNLAYKMRAFVLNFRSNFRILATSMVDLAPRRLLNAAVIR